MYFNVCKRCLISFKSKNNNLSKVSKHLISGSIEDNIEGLRAATKYGATEFFDVLMSIAVTYNMIRDDSQLKLELLTNVVKAENTEMLRTLLSLCPSVPLDLLRIAKRQKHAGISSLISVSSVKLKEEAKKEKTKQEVESGKASIFKLIPKDTEYDLYAKKKIDMITPLLNGKPVPYQTLLDELVVPQNHVGSTENQGDAWQKCPQDCNQKQNCSNLREVYFIADFIRRNLSITPSWTLDKFSLE